MLRSASAWVDRMIPLYVMISADAIRVFNFLAFMLVYSLSGLDPMQMFTGVLLLLLINSVAAQFFNPSRQAIMQVVIPSERRVEASAKAMFSLTGISVLSASLGPALGLSGPCRSMCWSLPARRCASRLPEVFARGCWRCRSGRHFGVGYWLACGFPGATLRYEPC